MILAKPFLPLRNVPTDITKEIESVGDKGVSTRLLSCPIFGGVQHSKGDYLDLSENVVNGRKSCRFISFYETCFDYKKRPSLTKKWRELKNSRELAEFNPFLIHVSTPEKLSNI